MDNIQTRPHSLPNLIRRAKHAANEAAHILKVASGAWISPQKSEAYGEVLPNYENAIEYLAGDIDATLEEFEEAYTLQSVIDTCYCLIVVGSWSLLVEHEPDYDFDGDGYQDCSSWNIVCRGRNK
jgi:hypothetical protein